MPTLKQIQTEAYSNAVKKGFWDNPDILRKLALVHSECSEAIEVWRASIIDVELTLTRLHPISGKPEGFPAELADIIIRVADLAEHLNIDLDEAVTRKLHYNQTRSHMHGKRA